MKKFFEEFKKFISRGNVFDLAIAVVMGGAFSDIVTSLVNNIIMPLVGILVGQTFSSLSIELNGSVITYGVFIQNVVNFLIIALCIFTTTKIANKIAKKLEDSKKKEKDKAAKEEKKEDENILLLKEIRDLLKESNKKA